MIIYIFLKLESNCENQLKGSVTLWGKKEHLKIHLRTNYRRRTDKFLIKSCSFSHFFPPQKKDGSEAVTNGYAKEKNGYGAVASKPKTNGVSTKSSFASKFFAFQIPCFLPAVTDFDEHNDQTKSESQYEDNNGGHVIRNSYISDDSSMRNRAFVSNQKSWYSSDTKSVVKPVHITQEWTNLRDTFLFNIRKIKGGINEQYSAFQLKMSTG